MGSAHIRLKRDYLYSEDRHCRRCGVETILPSIEDNGVLADNTATIQHIKPKFHPDYNKDITLWCYKCNNLDAQNKSKNHIYSRDEMVYFLSKPLKPLRGLYIVDGIAITYKDHKPIKIQEIYEAKLICCLNTWSLI